MWKSYFLGKKSEDQSQNSPASRKSTRKSARMAATGPHTISSPPGPNILEQRPQALGIADWNDR